MPSHPATACAETAPDFGWARRVLRQQLDALSRLTAIAWSLIEPAAPAAADPAPTMWSGLRNLEKSLRLHERVVWAQRLINALRARLTAELQALDEGKVPTPPVEARSVAAEAGRSTANEKLDLTDQADPAERPDPRERPERERFGFERRGSDKALARILKRPAVEIIALICRELGLPEDWPRQVEEAWAREERSRDDGGRGGDRPSCGVYPRVDLRSSPGDKLRMRAQSSGGVIFAAQHQPPTPTVS